MVQEMHVIFPACEQSDGGSTQSCSFERMDLLTRESHNSLKSNEPRHEKTCFSHMRTTKVQLSLRIRAVWSAPLLPAT